MADALCRRSKCYTCSASNEQAVQMHVNYIKVSKQKLVSEQILTEFANATESDREL